MDAFGMIFAFAARRDQNVFTPIRNYATNPNCYCLRDVNLVTGDSQLVKRSETTYTIITATNSNNDLLGVIKSNQGGIVFRI